MARAVIPEVPHHITQRGVRRFDVFLEDADRIRYLQLLKLYSENFQLQILAYCLMTNHIHVVGAPAHPRSIAQTFKQCHGIYATEFNKKYGKNGHLWQARPYSCVLDEAHTWAAIRYVERNPVRANMVERAEDYRWSSARAHCGIGSDSLLTRALPSDRLIENWSEWLAGTDDPDHERTIRERTFTGRPCGTQDFIKGMEAVVGRRLAPGKRGPRFQTASEESVPTLGTPDTT
jgi:putative transposase